MTIHTPTKESYGCCYMSTPSMLLSDRQINNVNHYNLPEELDILKLLDLKPDEKFYDLGSGNGIVLRRAVEKYDVQGIGIEGDPKLVEESRRNIRDCGLEDRIRIIHGNYYKVPLVDADAVYMFLNNIEVNNLREKLRRELKPGTRVLSLLNPIPGWLPTEDVMLYFEMDVFNSDNVRPYRSVYLYAR